MANSLSLRRPLKQGKWYSKSQAAWDDLSHQSKRHHTHVGRIEELDDGSIDKSNPCDRCTANGFECKRYTASAQLKYGTSMNCSRCRSLHMACGRDRDNADTDEEELVKPRGPKRASFGASSQGVVTKKPRLSRVPHPSSPPTPTEDEAVDELAELRNQTQQQDETRSTDTSSAKPVANDDNRAQALRDYAMSCLGDDANCALGSAIWARHQLAMMDTIASLQAEVRGLRAELRSRNSSFHIR